MQPQLIDTVYHLTDWLFPAFLVLSAGFFCAVLLTLPPTNPHKKTLLAMSTGIFCFSGFFGLSFYLRLTDWVIPAFLVLSGGFFCTVLLTLPPTNAHKKTLLAMSAGIFCFSGFFGLSFYLMPMLTGSTGTDKPAVHGADVPNLIFNILVFSIGLLASYSFYREALKKAPDRTPRPFPVFFLTIADPLKNNVAPTVSILILWYFFDRLTNLVNAESYNVAFRVIFIIMPLILPAVIMYVSRLIFMPEAKS